MFVFGFCAGKEGPGGQRCQAVSTGSPHSAGSHSHPTIQQQPPVPGPQQEGEDAVTSHVTTGEKSLLNTVLQQHPNYPPGLS